MVQPAAVLATGLHWADSVQCSLLEFCRELADFFGGPEHGLAIGVIWSAGQSTIEVTGSLPPTLRSGLSPVISRYEPVHLRSTSVLWDDARIVWHADESEGSVFAVSGFGELLDLITDRRDPGVTPEAAISSCQTNMTCVVEENLVEVEGLDSSNHFLILGHNHGRYFLFRRDTGQVLEFTKTDFTDGGFIQLAPLNWWEANFGAGAKGIDKRAAIEFIIRKAERRGLFTYENVRGRGAWMDDDRVVFHTGAGLIVDGVEIEPAKFRSRYVYPAERRLINLREAASDSEGDMLVAAAKLGRWACPDSALFLAGWMFIAPICGALRWRPHIWITGGAGTGKSTLIERYLTPLLRGTALVFDGGGTTEAGIRQTAGTDARPIILDEGEADDDSSRARMSNVIRLARSSSSAEAAMVVKGSAGGKPISFQLRGAFCVSSINLGLTRAADRDRFTVLGLQPKRAGDSEEHRLTELKHLLYSIESNPDLPARLLARALRLITVMLDSVDLFSESVARLMADRRFGDQHGTLLAGYWCLTHSKPPTSHEVQEVVEGIDWETVAGRVHAVADEFQCLTELVDARIHHHGVQVTVRTLLKVAFGIAVEGLEMGSDVAKRLLGERGLTISRSGSVTYLALRYGSTGVNEMLAKTRFLVDWAGHLSRLPGYRALPPTSFGSREKKDRAHGIPLSLIIQDLEAPDGTDAT